MNTFYSYFRGGNGTGIGAEQAGYTDIGGVELEQDVAAACDANFPHASTAIADVCAVDPATLLTEAPALFHASPSCKNASQAKSGAGETEQDRQAGQAVARFIAHWQPATVTIENVWQYRTFDAFEYILQALRDADYSFNYWHLNAADYGVPQTRKRLILIARRGLWRIHRPHPTHRNGGDMWHGAWNGWYGAIEDLVSDLPSSRFAPWQLARLPQDIADSFYTIPQRSDDKTGSEYGYGCPRRSPNDPALTVTATQSAGWYKAFLLNGTSDAGIRAAHEPCQTVVASVLSKAAVPRAFIVDGTANDHGASVTIRGASEPMMTVTANGERRRMRAFLVDQQNGSRDSTVRNADDPSFTITQYSTKHPTPRAWLDQGRVVAMTPRALARFQSFPDWYVLPERNALACQIIGNAVPPLLYQRIMEAI